MTTSKLTRYLVRSGSLNTCIRAKDEASAVRKAIKKTQPKYLGRLIAITVLDRAGRECGATRYLNVPWPENWIDG